MDVSVQLQGSYSAHRHFAISNILYIDSKLVVAIHFSYFDPVHTALVVIVQYIRG